MVNVAKYYTLILWAFDFLLMKVCNTNQCSNVGLKSVQKPIALAEITARPPPVR